jgi:hypothetical protein
VAPKPEHNTNTPGSRQTTASKIVINTTETPRATPKPEYHLRLFPGETRPRRRSIEPDRKKTRKSGTGETRNFGDGPMVRMINLFLVAPPSPPRLHRKEMVWIGEGGSRSGFELERGQSFFVTLVSLTGVFLFWFSLGNFFRIDFQLGKTYLCIWLIKVELLIK